MNSILGDEVITLSGISNELLYIEFDKAIFTPDKGEVESIYACILFFDENRMFKHAMIANSNSIDKIDEINKFIFDLFGENSKKIAEYSAKMDEKINQTLIDKKEEIDKIVEENIYGKKEVCSDAIGEKDCVVEMKIFVRDDKVIVYKRFSI